MYIWTHAKHVWNDGAAATSQEAQLDAKKLCPSPCPLQSGGGYPSWPGSAPQSPVHEKQQISTEQPQPTAAHRTITTVRRLYHIRLSALVRSQSTQFIVHATSQLGRGPPKRGHFSAILAGYSATENAAHSHILEPPDVDTDVILPLLVRNPAVTATNERDNITLLPFIWPPRLTSGDDSAVARPSVQHDEAGIDLHNNLVGYTKLEIAKALARHSVEIGLPKH